MEFPSALQSHEVFDIAVLEDFRKVSARYGVRRNVRDDHRPGLNNRPFADMITAQDDDAVSEPDAVIDGDIPVDVCLGVVGNCIAAVILMIGGDEQAFSAAMKMVANIHPAIAANDESVHSYAVAKPGATGYAREMIYAQIAARVSRLSADQVGKNMLTHSAEQAEGNVLRERQRSFGVEYRRALADIAMDGTGPWCPRMRRKRLAL